LVDQDGQHIDEQGNFIRWNKDGTCSKVDTSGRAVNEEGDFDIEHTAFLDDSGKPIDESVYLDESAQDKGDEEATTKPKRATRKRTKKPISSDN
jgi:hypothetical protein